MDIFAHRGSRATHPENTLPAFYEAVRLGVEGIECDVHLSLDNKLIVMHDETINRTTNREGLINHLTALELQQLDAGSWFYEQRSQVKQIRPNQLIKIPTLIDLLTALQSWEYRGTLNIEIKTDRYAYTSIEDILNGVVHSKIWSFNIIFSSFNPLTLIKMKRLNPNNQVAYLMLTLDPITLYFAKYFEKDAWHISYAGFIEIVELSNTSKEFKEYIERVKIRVWTANRPEKITYVYKNKADAVITDYPERAQFIRMALGGG